MTRRKAGLRNGRDHGPSPALVRCAIYTRKSTEEGLEQEFNSLDAQREAGEAFIVSQKGEGWTVLPGRYDDGGFTGGNMERPALKRLLADIEAGKVDCIVVYKVDRLSRSLMDFARIIEVFDRHQVAFVSVTQQFNTSTSMGRLVLNVLLSFAQFEREIIGERIRDKIAAQRRKGKWAGGFPILGYDVDRSGTSPKLVVNAAEAARVRQIFELYRDHRSLLPIVQELGRREWMNKQWQTKRGESVGGNSFDKGSLYALLTNPIYIGKIRHKADLYEGEHEAIITPEVFRDVQERLRKNGLNGGADVRNRYSALLKGLLFCKACGRAMVHTFTGKDRRRYRYYICTRAIKSGRAACPSRSLPALELEQAVVDEIRGVTQDADLRAEVLRQAREQLDSGVGTLCRERDELPRERARYESEIERLARKGVSLPSHAARLAELYERISRVEARLAELRPQIAAAERNCLDDAAAEAALARFDDIWAALSPREQVRLLALLVSRVEFDAADDTLAVTFQPTGIQTLIRQDAGDAA
jgi:site-specific DNA recombinase